VPKVLTYSSLEIGLKTWKGRISLPDERVWDSGGAPGGQTMKRVVRNVRRGIRITAGVVIVIAGLIMSIPGVPGAGLAGGVRGTEILAIDFVWAHRLRAKLQNKAVKAVNKMRGEDES
jgi:hypothetical protein